MTQHTVSRRKRRAFTLVELLVVIGIIAVLISVLLPALSRARGRAESIACQSNLRQIAQAAFNYAAENRGSLPYGFIFNRQQGMNSTAPGRPADGGSSGIITWFNIVDQYMQKRTPPTYLLDGQSIWWCGPTKRLYNPALKCPGAPKTFNQKVQYYNHGVAMPHMPLEMNPARRPAGQLPVLAPAKQTQLYPDTALFWDTALWYEAEPDVPSLFWNQEGITGFALGCSSIDRHFGGLNGGNARGLVFPEHPELRYRGPGGDRLTQSTNPMRNPTGPIAWLSDEYINRDPSQPGGAGPTANTDPAANAMYYVAFGGPRWRHHGNTTCNVAFADGSVRGLKLNSKRIVEQIFYENEFRRHMIMMKWPNDKKDSGIVTLN
jgi:prepilin-type N-terminal cleavage/methylation domain-containing protein/prepilin-type processing-associated H-X9-DG protein